MIAQEQTFRGVVHGRSIELDRETGLAEGATVSVTVKVPTGSIESLRQAFGGWSDDPEGVDRFVEEVRRDRQERPIETEV
jgi:hypothetical protein